MSMSLKAELETWAAALKAYDEQDFEGALDLFSRIADSSKILFNMGLIYATIGEHENAVEHFTTAVNLDNYLAIGYFQCGVSNFLLARYQDALANFEDAYLYLRGNEAINYEQLGLKFKLFSAEILFNKGLTQIYLGYEQEGSLDMQEASRQKVTEEHDVIDDAIRDRGEGYTVFSIPVGVLYRPSENKLKNSKTKDYLGKAKLVAATDSNDAFTEFTGVKKLQQTTADDAGVKESEVGIDLNRSATMPTRSEVARPTLDRSKTTVPAGNPARPQLPAAALASRRSQSISNLREVSAQRSGSDNPPLARNNTLGRSNTVGRGNALGRSNSAMGRSGPGSGVARSESRAGIIPLRLPTSQAQAQNSQPAATGAASVAGVGAGAPRSNYPSSGDASAPTSPLRVRPSIRKPVQFVEPPPVPSLPPTSLQPGQVMNMNVGQGNAQPYMLPGPESSTESQFFNTLMDAYTTEDVPQSQYQPPQQQQQRPSSRTRTRTPASPPVYQQPQPIMDAPQPTWMQGSQSPSLSSPAGSVGGHSRVPSRAAAGNGMMNANPYVNVGQGPNMGTGMNAGGGSLRRKVTRRPTVRRVTMYDEDEGDDGFVAGEYEQLEMSNIRVKIHFEDDIRGMTIPPTATFQEFVARVTTKFGTSMNGLGMKFKDEEGTMITLRDESDFELAVETARESAKGKSEGKIEVWCVKM